MTLSEFLNDFKSPFVLGAFFSRYKFSKDKTLIYTLSSYKKSNKFRNEELYLQSRDSDIEMLNSQSNADIWAYGNANKKIQRANLVVVLQNDLNLDENSFYKALLKKIFLSDFFLDSEFSDEKKSFLRGFFETRGSVDTSRQYLAQDFFKNSQAEVIRVRYLIDNFCVPSEVLNLNFRELQNQFTSGENLRNTQLRVNLFWYAKNIGFYNPYKVFIAQSAHGMNFNEIDGIYFCDCELPSFEKSAFNDRINFYLGSIYLENLSEFEIKKLRDELEFNKEQTDEFRRDGKIVNFMRFMTPDICACCSEKYDIKDRSFKDRSGKFYIEIHHVVSVGQDKELDMLENLSKLCPVCHRALKKGSSSEQYQKELITNILNANQQNLEFAKLIFDTNKFEILVDKIYKSLK